MRDVKERFKEIRISNKLSQKEFAEKLRKNIPFITHCLGNVSDTIIDKLVKEMVVDNSNDK